MKNDRFRAPIDDPYVDALGRATYTFARLEWEAVWCCERMKPDYVLTIEVSKKTAGQIAKDLLKLVKAHPDPAIQGVALAAAQEFERLVVVRNAILHGKPGTSKSGEQRLFSSGQELSIEDVNDAADDFVAGSLPLNALLHNELK
jgi:hypothetical protein